MRRQPEPEWMDLPEEAEAYARADFAQVNQAFVERLNALAGPCPDRRVVDLGCGPADILIRLAKTRPTWEILGVEAALAMRQWADEAIAREGLQERVRVVDADAKATGLPTASFDIVCSNSLLHHVSNPQSFWQEVSRLGRPGALVFVRDLYRPANVADARRLVLAYAGAESTLLQEEFYRSLLSAYAVPEIEAQLHAVGLPTLAVSTVTDRHVDIWGWLPTA